jgi:hypothetical protein
MEYGEALFLSRLQALRSGIKPTVRSGELSRLEMFMAELNKTLFQFERLGSERDLEVCDAVSLDDNPWKRDSSRAPLLKDISTSRWGGGHRRTYSTQEFICRIGESIDCISSCGAEAMFGGNRGGEVSKGRDEGPCSNVPMSRLEENCAATTGVNDLASSSYILSVLNSSRILFCRIRRSSALLSTSSSLVPTLDRERRLEFSDSLDRCFFSFCLTVFKVFELSLLVTLLVSSRTGDFSDSKISCRAAISSGLERRDVALEEDNVAATAFTRCSKCRRSSGREGGASGDGGLRFMQQLAMVEFHRL